MKVLKYAEHIVRKHDADRDGVLTGGELLTMHGAPARADDDGDGRISVDEMAGHVARFGYGRPIRLMSPSDEYLIRFSAGASGDGLAADDSAGNREGGGLGRADSLGGTAAEQSPADFKRFAVPASRIPAGLPAWFQERDRDGDLQLTIGEFAPRPTPDELREFTAYDANRDGLVTAWELLGLPATPRRSTQP